MNFALIDEPLWESLFVFHYGYDEKWITGFKTKMQYFFFILLLFQSLLDVLSLPTAEGNEYNGAVGWRGRKRRETEVLDGAEGGGDELLTKLLAKGLPLRRKTSPHVPYEVPHAKNAWSGTVPPEKYSRASCSSTPGRVVCSLGRYVFVINTGGAVLEPDLVERLAALVYHRTEEGESEFSVSVDMEPPNAEGGDTSAAHLAEPKPESGSPEERGRARLGDPVVPPGTSGDPNQRPVYVECDPAPGGGGASPSERGGPPGSTEIVYNCRRRTLGGETKKRRKRTAEVMGSPPKAHQSPREVPLLPWLVRRRKAVDELSYTVLEDEKWQENIRNSDMAEWNKKSAHQSDANLEDDQPRVPSQADVIFSKQVQKAANLTGPVAKAREMIFRFEKSAGLVGRPGVAGASEAKGEEEMTQTAQQPVAEPKPSASTSQQGQNNKAALFCVEIRPQHVQDIIKSQSNDPSLTAANLKEPNRADSPPSVQSEVGTGPNGVLNDPMATKVEQKEPSREHAANQNVVGFEINPAAGQENLRTQNIKNEPLTSDVRIKEISTNQILTEAKAAKEKEVTKSQNPIHTPEALKETNMGVAISQNVGGQETKIGVDQDLTKSQQINDPSATKIDTKGSTFVESKLEPALSNIQWDVHQSGILGPRNNKIPLQYNIEKNSKLEGEEIVGQPKIHVFGARNDSVQPEVVQQNKGVGGLTETKEMQKPAECASCGGKGGAGAGKPGGENGTDNKFATVVIHSVEISGVIGPCQQAGANKTASPPTPKNQICIDLSALPCPPSTTKCPTFSRGVLAPGRIRTDRLEFPIRELGRLGGGEPTRGLRRREVSGEEVEEQPEEAEDYTGGGDEEQAAAGQDQTPSDQEQEAGAANGEEEEEAGLHTDDGVLDEVKRRTRELAEESGEEDLNESLSSPLAKELQGRLDAELPSRLRSL